jgi:hypothetical protein
VSGAPQLEQNRVPSAFCVPHLGQNISIPPYTIFRIRSGHSRRTLPRPFSRFGQESAFFFIIQNCRNISTEIKAREEKKTAGPGKEAEAAASKSAQKTHLT